MVLRFYQSAGTVITELVNAVALGEGNPGLTQAAEVGEIATCQIIVHDPDSTLDLQAQKRLYVNEDEETAGDTRVWWGYIGDRDIERTGAGLMFTAATGRAWTVSLEDANAQLAFRIFPAGGTAANRPAETVGARLTWLLATSQMSTVHDNGRGYVNYPTGGSMDPCDYRGQFAVNVLGDMAKAKEYNFYAYYDQGSGNIGLWFNSPNGTAFTSPLNISNVEADILASPGTCYPPLMDAVLNKSPSRVFSGIDYVYGGGSSVYVQSTATAAAFYSRDTSISEPNVKSLAEATRRGSALLTSFSTEDERVKCSVVLPSAQINDIKAGHRLMVRFSHLGGFETGIDWSVGAWTRVLRRTVRDIENRTQAYRALDLELTPLAVETPHEVVISGITTHTGGYGSVGNHTTGVGYWNNVWEDTDNFCGQGVYPWTGSPGLGYAPINLAAGAGFQTITVPSGCGGLYRFHLYNGELTPSGEDLGYQPTWPEVVTQQADPYVESYIQVNGVTVATYRKDGPTPLAAWFPWVLFDETITLVDGDVVELVVLNETGDGTNLHPHVGQNVGATQLRLTYIGPA